MQLGDVLHDVTLDAAAGRVEVDRVEIDSRASGPGTLFFAMPGQSDHGANYAARAVERGAVAVVSDRDLSLDVPVVVVDSSRLYGLLTRASSAVVGDPASRLTLVGVTGTNGKTTTTTLVSSLASSVHWNAASMGTLTNQRTTPAPPELFRSLAATLENFASATTTNLVAMEVSSHALDQKRVDGLHFAVVVFTNLGHDHLDYHHTMEEYFAAKATLFDPQRADHAVIWVDDPYGARLASMTSLPVTAVRRSDASDVTSSLLGSSFFWRGHLVNSSLVGDYNVDNALLAMTVLSVLGVDDETIARAMGECRPVPGRFEVFSERGVTVVVDYAHTPDGLERLLRDVRALAGEGRVICVVGAGGDRDPSKRPAMGLVASRDADFTVLTSDNPRSEDPDAIMDAVEAGTVAGASVVREVNRRSAIARALASAQEGDVVVIAGKGHETTQIVGDEVTPFDDRQVAKELLR